jgi:hypothetical protein
MHPADPSELLSPHQRRRDLAAILAAGLFRLGPQAAESASSPPPTISQNSPEFQRDCLEVRGETRLSVPNG